MDSILRAMPGTPENKSLYLPNKTDITEARKFRREGWITIDGLETGGDDRAEANRLRCSHFLSDGEIKKL